MTYFPGPVRFTADRGDARLRLDQVLVRRITVVTRMSRSVAQRWIESGVVTIDGRPARRPAARIREGTTVEVTIPSSAVRRTRPEAEAVAIEILYEDSCLIAVNKPSGMIVHPSYKHVSGTLLNAVLWRMRNRAEVRPGILTRLDKDTSGLVVIALTAEVHATMQRDAAAGRVKKEYLAIVHGSPHPPQGRIRQPLGRDPHDRRRVVIMPGGADSETRYDVIATRRGDEVMAARRSAEGAEAAGPPWRSVVRCELVTGRTHQIRVHLASRGWPILGDRVYGTADAAISRQALHAWRIALPHPISREPLLIEAPVAEDMRALIS